MANGMIRAQMTLSDGITPGAMRYGMTHILALIARGCRIVPNPLNAIPHELNEYLVAAPEQPKRGRPKKKTDADLLPDT
jgi:hypothetical protein